MTASPATVSQENDHSVDFHRLRSNLRSNDGRPYVDFVLELKPRYLIVLRDILLGYAALGGTSLLVSASRGHGWIAWCFTAAGAVSIGFWIAYLQLFMHEAAHFNLAPSRKRNDFFANIGVCAMVGQEITRYRRIHFQHHRALGRHDDTEQTYASALTPIFLLKTLTGVRALEVVARRDKHLSQASTQRPEGFLSPWILATAAIHGTVLGSALWTGDYPLAVAWVAGVGICFPFFAALRNLLEHRPAAVDMADSSLAVTRVFGDDAFSRTFGAAGFNRHLLHHWEPQVSYTNLPELDGFLKTTPLARIVEERRASYWQTALDLWKVQ